VFLFKIGSPELNTLAPAFLPLIKDMVEALKWPPLLCRSICGVEALTLKLTF
jgi:hypothetical protein